MTAPAGASRETRTLTNRPAEAGLLVSQTRTPFPTGSVRDGTGEWRPPMVLSNVRGPEQALTFADATLRAVISVAVGEAGNATISFVALSYGRDHAGRSNPRAGYRCSRPGRDGSRGRPDCGIRKHSVHPTTREWRGVVCITPRRRHTPDGALSRFSFDGAGRLSVAMRDPLNVNDRPDGSSTALRR